MNPQPKQTPAQIDERQAMSANLETYNQNAMDGSSVKLTSADLDAIAGCANFAESLRSVKWLTGRDGELTFPNFLRHNGSSAKARALESEAKRLRRLSDKGPDAMSSSDALPASLSDNVSDKCPTKDGLIVRPEKRREEKRRVNKEEIARQAKPAEPKRQVHLADEEYLKQIRESCKDLDFDRELAAMKRWILSPKGRGRKLTQQFVVNWINRADRTLATTPSASKDTYEDYSKI